MGHRMGLVYRLVLDCRGMDQMGNVMKTNRRNLNDAIKLLGTSWVLHRAYRAEHNPAHAFRSGSYHLAKFVAGKSRKGN